MLFLLFSLLVSCQTGFTNEVYDLRIYEEAEKGTRLTMSVALQRKMEKIKNCYGQLETDIMWMEYRSSYNAFYTIGPISETRADSDLTGTLHLLCAANRMYALDFRVLISHRNHHPPTFGRDSYEFFVPVTIPVNSVIGKMEVTDNDAVIYNSERQLSFPMDQSLLNIKSDGTLTLKKGLVDEIPYKKIRMQVLAIDYGSPQLYSLANLTITPVTVSAVRELRVNVATQEYQIFEWDIPAHGHADKYRLTMRKGDDIIYEEDIDGRKTVALTRVPIAVVGSFSYQITAIDFTGETPSDRIPFYLLHNVLECVGQCSSGGVPICYYGAFNRVEQFVDSSGGHCLCFPGFTGNTCDNIAKCQPEKTIDSYGGLDWFETESNRTIRVQCPYNKLEDGEWIERTCVWDKHINRAVWGRGKEEGKCKLQTSVLTHLAMLGTFASNANSVSTIHTVARFITDLLAVPAFSNDTISPAHFDQKIAENVARVVDNILYMDIDSLQGNTTVAKWELWLAVRQLASRLPVPFALSSPDHGVQMKSIHWTRHADAIDNALGTRCRINLPKVNPEQTLRAICMTNATLFDIVEETNPVLSLHSDNAEPFHFSKLVILLKPKDQLENYTCVFYDEIEGGWSTRGVRLIHSYYHGFVRCETNHLGIFSLLPERYFAGESDPLRDLGNLVPTATSVIAIICSVFLLFMAAVQRNQSIDFALLIYLFFVFLLHISHLVMIVAPQVGDPFAASPSIHLLIQFCVLSLSASLYLVLSSLHDVILSKERSKEEQEEQCCSRGCTIISLSFLLPFVLTFSTYYFAEEYDHDIASLIDRVDWLFLCNYLAPTIFFISLVVAYGIWNVYLGNAARSRHRGSEDRFLALSPTIQASLTSLFMVFFLGAAIILFLFRNQSILCSVLFSVSQILYSCAAFVFAACIFRSRFQMENETSGSCHSLERKRDISRALLDHVNTSKHSENGSSLGESDMYLHMSQNLYDRQPMVSIV